MGHTGPSSITLEGHLANTTELVLFLPSVLPIATLKRSCVMLERNLVTLKRRSQPLRNTPLGLRR